jgi:hypothetical protein
MQSKRIIVQTLTININNDSLVDRVVWLLEHFKNDGVEIVANEDSDDFKLLKATRQEETIPFEEYLQDEN